MEQGISAMKFFPSAAAGGIPMLTSINGPLAGLTFCPTGGVNADNAGDYLALDNVACVGGSWMMPRRHIDQRNWQAITDLATRAANII
jgi:2-dehydro-3-deoxyphosphogluconate aldolase/(4S)-4-hydroxy-2-oxoglutarate aldolase